MRQKGRSLKGKERDNIWIAHYASSCFGGSALRWFEGLDDEVQEDWKKLRKAMLDKWPEDKKDELAEKLATVSLMPTPPAAAPPLAPPSPSKPQLFESLSSTVKRGFIRLDGIPSTSRLYIDKERDSTGSFWTTVQAKDRMPVEIEVKTPPHRIKVLNVEGCTWLALKWKLILLVEKGSAKPAGLVAINESGKFHCKDTREEWAGPHRSIIWSVAMDGTIQAWWQEGITCLMEAVYRDSDNLVMFVADPDTYVKKYPEWKQVRLLFEPVS